MLRPPLDWPVPGRPPPMLGKLGVFLSTARLASPALGRFLPTSPPRPLTCKRTAHSVNKGAPPKCKANYYFSVPFTATALYGAIPPSQSLPSPRNIVAGRPSRDMQQLQYLPSQTSRAPCGHAMYKRTGLLCRACSSDTHAAQHGIMRTAFLASLARF